MFSTEKKERIFETVQFPFEMQTELAHRFPAQGGSLFRIGTTVIVRDRQNAVVVANGKHLATFNSGCHRIAADVVPLLKECLGGSFSETSPFPAYAYFVSANEFRQIAWNTAEPIRLYTQSGIVPLYAEGNLSFCVDKPEKFVVHVESVGKSIYTLEDLMAFLGKTLTSTLQLLLNKYLRNGKILSEITSNLDGIASEFRAESQKEFDAAGIILRQLQFAGIIRKDG